MSTTGTPFQTATMRTVATRLLPFLLICYAIAFIDRTNIAVASLTMNADIGLSDAAFGLGAGLFFITYTVLEVPSNLILARVGARLWIMRIMITWGIVTILMAFVSNEWTFYAGRLLLGACEAGFYPGVIYFLSRWFPGQFRGRAFAMFQIGGPIALMIGSPLAGALLGLDGAAGVHGWQWVFIITGIPAIIAGVLTLFRLDDSPQRAKWLTAEQRAWLQGRIDAETDAAHSHGSAVWRSPIVWLVSGVNFFIILALYGVSLWLPRLVQATTGASNFAASAISAIPYVAAVAAVILVARFADRSGKYRIIVISCCAAGALGLAFAATVGNPWVSLVGIAIASGGLYAAIPSMWSMTTQVIAGPAAAAAVAVISAIGNVGGFVGPYLAGIVNEASGRPASSLYLMGASLLAAMLCAATVRHTSGETDAEPDAATAIPATTPNGG